jgi:hypothetical protein
LDYQLQKAILNDNREVYFGRNVAEVVGCVGFGFGFDSDVVEVSVGVVGVGAVSGVCKEDDPFLFLDLLQRVR